MDSPQSDGWKGTCEARPLPGPPASPHGRCAAVPEVAPARIEGQHGAEEHRHRAALARLVDDAAGIARDLRVAHAGTSEASRQRQRFEAAVDRHEEEVEELVPLLIS